MGLIRRPKVWFGGTVALTVLLALACFSMHAGVPLAAVSDIICALLMLSALVAFAVNGIRSQGRIRWFWMLQAAGWSMWLADQCVWITFDLILQKKVPAMYPADALLFLAGAPMIAGVILRPDRQPSDRSARLGLLDFLLLLLWWLYLYFSFVICWQYVTPNEDHYNRNFDILAAAGTLLFAALLAMFWRKSSGRWKRLYAAFFAAVVTNGISFYVLNVAIERNVYYTGSWYDIPYAASFAVFTAVALLGSGLSPNSEGDGESYFSFVANLAMMAVLSLPIVALWTLLDKNLPTEALHFRLLVTLSTMFLMALLLFIQHYRLNRELRHTNVVLQEASLTDPLTGLRNRRYFSAIIEADVGQALRSHADGHDHHARDLVFYLIDADNFKEVNDRFGHDIGDQVLIEMSRRLSSSIRHSDVLVRWGGEEFLIVSRYTDRSEAELLAQRVLTAVADLPFRIGPGGETFYRTCSIGWATFPWFLDDPRSVSYEEVLTLADRGLNRAKHQGRNCAIGMLPASGEGPCTIIEGLHSTGLQVDVLALAGPVSHT